MQWNDPTLELTAPSTASIIFNVDSGGAYLNDPTQCSGLDGAPLRVTIEDRPQTDGAILHPFFKGARHITLTGTLLFLAVADRQDAEDALISLCEELVIADGTLAWASAARSITVRCDILPVFTGGYLKSYQFGLVAADPTISGL